MKYEEFVENIRSRTEEKCGPEYQVRVTEALKNNSVKLRGLAILKEGSNITPTIYLEDYYTDYCDGDSIDEIVERILDVYRKNRCPDGMDLALFGDFEKAKERIVFRVISYDRNEELLSRVPHRRFLDLAVIYCISLGETACGYATVTIYHEHLASWGETEETLWEIAKENTPRILEPQIVSLAELVREMTGMEQPELSCTEEPLMYVLTNKRRINGAACMLYGKTIRDFASSLRENLYILPSSIHEVILLAANGETDPERLAEMVREVNETQVGEQDILSDRLYYYSYRTGEMTLAVS